MENQTIFQHPQFWQGTEKRSHGHVPLRLWCAPSFRPWVAWAIIRIRNDLYLRRVVWSQRSTNEIDGCEVPLVATTYDAVITELSLISISPFPKSKFRGVDGTAYGLEWREGFVWTSLRWWQSQPEEWTSLQLWHARTIKLFDSLLPSA